MANDYRDRDRNRGMFGYEGEGFLRGGEDFGVADRWRSERDDRGDFSRGFAGGYGTERPSYRGRGPKNYQRSDERIREDVCERLAMDHDVDASDIEVTVSEGTVVLAGSVQDRRAKRRAEDISESVHGVKDVENQIRVARNESQY